METAFLGAVWLYLGKLLEFNADLATIRRAGGAGRVAARRLSRSGPSASSGGRCPLEPHLSGAHPYVMPDDDINYIVLGMLLLEEHGADLRTAHTGCVCHLPWPRPSGRSA